MNSSDDRLHDRFGGWGPGRNWEIGDISRSRIKHWSLPPYSVDWGINGGAEVMELPRGCYPGDTPGSSHVAITDADGNLAAFITNGWLYNRMGECIAEISSTTGEIQVIPVPGITTRFFVVTSDAFYSGSQLRNCVAYGEVDISGSVTYSRRDTLWETESIPFVAFTASTIHEEDMSRDLYAFQGKTLMRFTVKAGGIADSAAIGINGRIPGGAIAPYAEMEIHESVYREVRTTRLAMALGPAVVVYELDTAGDIATLLTSVKVKLADPANPSTMVMTPGIEFSPNGWYVYITSAEGLGYLVVDKSANRQEEPVIFLFARYTHAFMTSQIETGPDGNLYLVGPYGLARLRRPNEPENASWDTTAIEIGGLKPIDVPDGRCYVLQNEIDPVWMITADTLSGVSEAARRKDVLNMEQPFPSPAHDRVEVRFTAGRRYSASAIRLQNVVGGLVQEIRMAEGLEPGIHTLALDLRGLPAGTYFVSIEADGSSAVKMIQVVR